MNINYTQAVNDMLNADAHFNINLACAVGINAAILLGSINYLVKLNTTDRKSKTHYHKDNRGVQRWWVYRTIDEWADTLPFMSKRTIERTLDFLRDLKLVDTGKFNQMPMDHTLWYTVDHNAVFVLMDMWDLSGRPVRADTGKQTEQYSQFMLAYNKWIEIRDTPDYVTVTGSIPSPWRDLITSPWRDAIPEEPKWNKTNKNTPAGGIDKNADTEEEEPVAEPEPSTLEDEKEFLKEEKEDGSDNELVAGDKILQYDDSSGSYLWIGRIDRFGKKTYLKTPKAGYNKFGSKSGGINKRQDATPKQASPSSSFRNKKEYPQKEQKSPNLPTDPLEMDIVVCLREYGKNERLGSISEYQAFMTEKLAGLQISIREFYEKDPDAFRQLITKMVTRIVPEDTFVSKEQFFKQLALEIISKHRSKPASAAASSGKHAFQKTLEEVEAELRERGEL